MRRVLGHGIGAAAAVALLLGSALSPVAAEDPPSPVLTSQQQAAVDSDDPRVEVDDEGRPFVTDPIPPPRPQSRSGAAPAAALAPALAPYPYDQTFQLHSRPGSQRTLYLDFNGGTISGTVWNGGEWNTPPSFVAAPFSLDLSSAFSNTERDYIQSIWQRVAEDFAPFDIDVTTQAPSLAALDRTGPGDQVYGTTAMITDTTNYIADECNCAGAAYVDVFDVPGNHQTFQPAWIFADVLSDDLKGIAEVVSHEVGHTFGLLHDGQGAEDYYLGHGVWAPIMGSGYYNPLVQWSKGEYPGATNPDPPFPDLVPLQDDIALIAENGAPLAADDHGDSAGTATTLTGPGTATAFGTIGTDADTDWFAIDVAAGPISFTAYPAPTSPNLDIRLELRSADASLDIDDPPVTPIDFDRVDGLGASVSANVAEGTYYLKVEGVGAGTLATGYSGYGSLGRYAVAASFTPPPAEPYHAIAPERLLDTRVDPGVPVGTGQHIELQVTGRFGVPADAKAVAINVAAVAPSGPGHVTVYPCGQPKPTASNLNYVTGQTVPVLVVSGLSPSGKVCIYTFRSAHIVVDLSGWYPAGSSYQALVPNRLLDTRSTTPIPSGASRELQVAGQGGVPAGATAVVLNVAVTEASAAGHLRVYPCGGPLPTASNLNYVAGQTVANLVISGLGTGAKAGKVCFFAFKSTDLVVDVSGWHAPAGSHKPLAPARLMDTRQTTPLADGGTRQLQVTGVGGVPAGVDTVILSVAVTEPSFAGHLRVYPCGGPLPTASNLNYVPGQTVANLVISGLGNGGKVCFFAFKSTHVVVDVFGYDDDT